MNIDELVDKLNGLRYPLNISSDLISMAKESGLVIVTGRSDDIVSFCGAVDGEGEAYDGGDVFVHSEGVLDNFENLESENELEEYYANKGKSQVIHAFWYKGDVKWSYDTKIPHKTFKLLKGDDVACVGLVFSVSDI